MRAIHPGTPYGVFAEREPDLSEKGESSRCNSLSSTQGQPFTADAPNFRDFWISGGPTRSEASRTYAAD